MGVKLGNKQQQTYNTNVESKNGTYTVGMTRKQAEKNGSYKAKIGIDFNDLDKDKNGILSQKEILEGRVKSAKRGRNMCYAAGGMSAVAGCLGGITETVCTGGLGFVPGLAMMGAGTTIGANTIAIGKEEYETAKQELQRYNEDPIAQIKDQKYKLNQEF